MRKSCYKNPLTFIVSMIFLMDDMMRWGRKLSWCRSITLSQFFGYVESGMFFTQSDDVTQQYGMVRYHTTVKLVRTLARRRWLRSLYHTIRSLGEKRLLKSRVFDTRLGAKMSERTIIQRLHDFPHSYLQRKFHILKWVTQLVFLFFCERGKSYNFSMMPSKIYRNLYDFHSSLHRGSAEVTCLFRLLFATSRRMSSIC